MLAGQIKKRKRASPSLERDDECERCKNPKDRSLAIGQVSYEKRVRLLGVA
jgi:hypothetical protein